MSIVRIENNDVLQTRCDVLVLKYAQGFYGADLAVAKALGVSSWEDGRLPPGKHLCFPTKGKLPCKRVLFVGTPQLWDFSYAQIREFSRRALSILGDKDFEKTTVAMTMHGVGYGLDEKEAFSAQVAGLMEYFHAYDTTWSPEAITIVERDGNRAERIAAFLSAIQIAAGVDRELTSRPSIARQLPDAGIKSDAKKHVFVAMPYDDQMQDVYEFGICEPVNGAGCLCERCDRSVFTGDVLDRIKKRISSATVVVADMTGANPNVYLEVGYAWGKGIPTLLVAKKGEELQFDVKTHNCIYYKNISDLRKQLSQLMPGLTTDRLVDG